MNSIIQFIDGDFSVDGKYFNDLNRLEKDSFLTYEIAIIELQLEGDNPEIKEIFQRLNRTFYSLTNIEKLSTEYAPSEIMLVAKLISKEIEPKLPKEHYIDPNIPESFIIWAMKEKVSDFNKLILEGNIFSAYEVSRKVPLMIILNIIENSYWVTKANFFSIIIFLYQNYDIVHKRDPLEIKEKLDQFEKELPNEYQLAAKEAVNNKKERIIRDKHLRRLILLQESIKENK